MKSIITKILISSFLLLNFQLLKAQINDSLSNPSSHNKIHKSNELLAEVVLKDGNILRGNILNEYVDSITFNSSLTGTITILRVNILYIKYFNPDSKGSEQVYVNLASRYFFSPSAMNMKKGDGYYQNTFFTLSTVNYAINDYLTIGGGFELFSLLFGHPIVILTPKFSIPVAKNLHVGGGLLYANMLGLVSSSGGLNVAYGNITYGDTKSNISVNVGTSLSYPGSPTFTVCGFHQMSPKFGLMTENWIIPSGDNSTFNLYTFGGRVIGRKNLFDFGLITNQALSRSLLPAIPFLSYTLRF